MRFIQFNSRYFVISQQSISTQPGLNRENLLQLLTATHPADISHSLQPGIPAIIPSHCHQRTRHVATCVHIVLKHVHRNRCVLTSKTHSFHMTQATCTVVMCSAHFTFAMTETQNEKHPLQSDQHMYKWIKNRLVIDDLKRSATSKRVSLLSSEHYNRP